VREFLSHFGLHLTYGPLNIYTLGGLIFLDGIGGSLILPALVSAWIWVLAHAMRSFSIPLILASADTELISVQLWFLWNDGDATLAAALGVLIIIFLASLTAVGRWAVVRMSPQDE